MDGKFLMGISTFELWYNYVILTLSIGKLQLEVYDLGKLKSVLGTL